MRIFGFLFAILLLGVGVIAAQETACSLTQQATVAEAAGWCADLAVGELCYGDAGVNVLDNEGELLEGGLAGDRVSLVDISQVETLIRDTAYGLALLQAGISYLGGSDVNCCCFSAQLSSRRHSLEAQ